MNANRSQAAAVATLLVAFGIAPASLAQDPGKDDALQKLLQELDGPKGKAKAPAAKPKDEAKAEEPKKAEDTKDRKPAELAPKDKALDDLLGKLGATEDTPAPDEPRKPGPPSEPMPGQEGGDTPDGLQGREKQLDEHLRELTGKRRKKDPQDGEDGQDQGPLGDVIRQMREVEQRLGEPDTGEQTRQRQEQIVKKLETLIEQARQSQGQMRLSRRMQQKPGQQKPGEQPGQTPGAMAGGAPNQRPEKPSVKSILALDKDAWGHLEEQLREEMANIFKEVALPAKEELVKRYYLAVSKKSVTRED